MAKPVFLVTNDDGIDVFFFRALLRALSRVGTVYAAAPAREQSWIGKAVSRHNDVRVDQHLECEGCEAWTIDGTPSDCVNIALGHLLPQKPDVVVSGINIGFNAFLPMIYSSGTIAGALEGAAWGMPAVALSLHLDHEDFNAVKDDAVNVSSHLEHAINNAAAHGTQFAQSLIGKANDQLIVHNINYPTRIEADTETIRTQPARIKLGSLFEKAEGDHYRFRFHEGEKIPATAGLPTDYSTLLEGKISHTLLDFSKLG